MIITAVVLFFLIGVVAIYALIQTGKNYAIQAVLIPIILVGTLYAGYAIYVLQGTPRIGIPKNDVEIVFIEMQKPWIIFLARDVPEGDEAVDPIPKYFRIVYNEENKKTMNELIRQIEMGQKVEGRFKAKKAISGGIEPPSGEYRFDNILRENLGPKQYMPEQDLIIGVDPNVDSSISNRLLRNDNTPLANPRVDNPNQDTGVHPPAPSPSNYDNPDHYYPSWDDFPEF